MRSPKDREQGPKRGALKIVILVVKCEGQEILLPAGYFQAIRLKPQI